MLYGRGPGITEPQFYDPGDRAKLAAGPNAMGSWTCGVTATGRAIIPDRRNDENLIISQFHKAAQFHNRIVDYARRPGHPSKVGVRDRPPADPLALPVGRHP